VVGVAGSWPALRAHAGPPILVNSPGTHNWVGCWFSITIAGEMSTVRKISSILLPGQRRGAIALLGLILVSTLLEMVSIGLVVPALAFMTGSVGTPSQSTRPWLEWLGNPSSNQLMLLVLLVLLGVYAVKSAFLLLVAYWQSRFVSDIQSSTSRRLFAIYLSQPWTFHLQRNSAELVRAITDAQQFSQICTTLIMTVSELLVLVGLVAILLWFEPAGALVVAGMLGGAAWLFNRLARTRSRRWGVSRQHHTEMFLKHLQQGLGGAKDVKIRGCEQEFIEQFRIHTDGVARMGSLQSLVEQMPRMWFELLAVASLLLLTTVMVWQGTPTRSLLPMLGLFATVAYRLLPSVNHMTASVQRLRFAESLINSLVAELALEQSVPVGAPALPVRFRDCISIEDVSYRYPAGHETVLTNVSIRIPHGASVGLVGGSGAGKSTLVDVILGLLPPTAGRVTIDGDDIHSNLRGWQDVIGYVSQSIYLCDDTIRRNVAFGVPEELVDDDAVRRALRAAQLDEFVDGLPKAAETFVGERGIRLSGGQRQRIGIARALYHDPQVLVLDEATSALDTETEKEVMAAVNALHGAKTLIIVAHRLTTVSDCDLLYRLEKGRVVQSGTFAEVVPG
jgi:ABC-type multidrug transport system fused ATPase/permease subunit